jgi:hypothetical protein
VAREEVFEGLEEIIVIKFMDIFQPYELTEELHCAASCMRSLSYPISRIK